MIINEASVFPVIVFDGDHKWEDLIPRTSHYLDKKGLERLKPLLEDRCKSVIIEREYIDKDYRDTFSHFHSKRFVTPPSRGFRLHFFGEAFEPDDFSSERAYEEDKTYLGYCVVRATRPNSIGRTLLCYTLRPNSRAYMCLCHETVQIMGEKLTIQGFPFISQDEDATTCAESSLWMMMRYLSNRYKNYSEKLPFQITKLASSRSSGTRIFPSSGLFSGQLAEVLKLCHVSPVIYDRMHHGVGFEHLLYTYIESGFPVLTTVNEHVFVSFGHSYDFTRTIEKPEGDWYNYSSFYNESLVICDDTEHPYQSLWETKKMAEGHGSTSSQYDFSEIQEFIVPLPERAFLPAESAQKAIENVIRGSKTGIEKLSDSLRGKEIILRLFLTTGRSFKAALRKRGMGNQEVVNIYRHIPLPHFVWICEISVVNDYTQNKEVHGEVIWDATRNAAEPDGWIALHYPEILIFDTGSIENLNRQDMRENELQNSTPYPLFRSNLHPIE